MNDDIKPCPFCGNAVAMYDMEGYPTKWFEVHCVCQVAPNTPLCETVDKVRELWNSRPYESALQEENRKLALTVSQLTLKNAELERTLFGIKEGAKWSNDPE